MGWAGRFSRVSLLRVVAKQQVKAEGTEMQRMSVVIPLAGTQSLWGELGEEAM